MGYRIIADLTGFVVEQNGNRVVINDPHWRGYLANLSPSEFEQRFAAELPVRLRGEEFLARYGGTTDIVTNIEPGRAYEIHAPTAHAVYENARVHRFAEFLRGQLGQEEKVALGKLMYESHASYSACGLGSKGTDLLVELARSAGADRGIFGAKITGGGSGGTVAVLGSRDAEDTVADVAGSFAELTGHRPYIFRGSSAGSAAFGHVVVRKSIRVSSV